MTRTVLIALALCGLASAVILFGWVRIDGDRTAALAIVWAAGVALVARRVVLARVRRRSNPLDRG